MARCDHMSKASASAVVSRAACAMPTSTRSPPTTAFANGGVRTSLARRSYVERPCATLAPPTTLARIATWACVTPDSKAEVRTTGTLHA